MKEGVVDLLEKPFEEAVRLEAICSALAGPPAADDVDPEKQRLKAVLETLSPRERDVLDRVIDGKMN
jgi:two-component system response regulator FixJ